MEELAPDAQIVLLQSEISTKQQELERLTLKNDELTQKEFLMDQERDEILGEIEQIEGQLMEQETLESEEESIVSRQKDEKTDCISLIQSQIEEIDQKQGQAVCQLQLIEVECQTLDFEEGLEVENLPTQVLEGLKEHLESLEKEEQDKFQVNLDLITQIQKIDQENSQMTAYEQQLKHNLENWKENQRNFLKHQEQLYNKRKELNETFQQEMDQILVKKFLESLRNTNLHQVSQSVQSCSIESLTQFEHDTHELPLSEQLIPSETKSAIELMQLAKPQLYEIAENISKKASSCKKVEHVSDDLRKRVIQVNERIIMIGSQIIKQSDQMQKLSDIRYQIKNSKMLTFEKDFESCNQFREVDKNAEKIVGDHKQSLELFSYLKLLADAYSQLQQNEVLPSLYKNLLNQLQDIKLLQPNILQICISDLTSLQDQIMAKLTVIYRLNLLIAKLHSQLTQLQHEVPLSIEKTLLQTLERVYNAKSVISKVPSEVVTIQTLLTMEADLKDIDIEGLREAINDHREKEKMQKIDQALGARDQTFRDQLQARRIKDQRMTLKRDIQALQQELDKKLETQNIPNQKAKDLAKLRLKGQSDVQLAEIKLGLQKALQEIQIEADRVKELNDKKIQDSQKQKELQRLNEDINSIQQQIKDQLKTYDLQSSETLSLINEILQCEKLRDPEMVDDFKVAKNKLQRREKRDSIKTEFKEEGVEAAIDEMLKKAKDRYKEAKQELDKVGLLNKKLQKQKDLIRLDVICPLLINKLQIDLNQMNENLQTIQTDQNKLLKLTEKQPEQNSQIITLQKFLQKIHSDLKNDNEPKLRQLRKAQEPHLQLQKLHQLSISLQQKETDLKNLRDQIAFLLNKYQDQELAQRVSFITKDSEDFKYRIEKVTSLIGIFQELCDEFSGYCSDDYEEDLVKKLQTSDLREIEALLRMICEENDVITDKISLYQRKQIQKGSEDKLKEIEDSLLSISRDICEIERRVLKIEKAFEKIPAVAKIVLRDGEVSELDRKLGQLEIMIGRVMEESQAIVEKHQMDSEKEEQVQEMQGLRGSFQELLQDVNEKLLIGLQDIKNQIIIVQTAPDQGHFQTLKLNKHLKKLILNILKGTKDARETYKKFRHQFEALKLKFRSIPKYVPLLGDDVDKLLADWITKNNCPIPIARMGGGYYQFGSKKVYAKITNGKLLIRVGGGYMGIDEFMYYYGAPELNKMLAYDEIDLDDESAFGCVLKKEENKQNIISEFGDGRTVIGSQQLKRRLSPRPKMTSDGTKSPRVIPQKTMASPRQHTPMTQFSTKMASVVIRKSAQGLNSPRSSNQSHQNNIKSTLHSEQVSNQRPNSTQANAISKKITPRPFKEIIIDDLTQHGQVSFRTDLQPQTLPQEDDYTEYLKYNIAEINPTSLTTPSLQKEELKLNLSQSSGTFTGQNDNQV